jgi:hypothetical protein
MVRQSSCYFEQGFRRSGQARNMFTAHRLSETVASGQGWRNHGRPDGTLAEKRKNSGFSPAYQPTLRLNLDLDVLQPFQKSRDPFGFAEDAKAERCGTGQDGHVLAL